MVELEQVCHVTWHKQVYGLERSSVAGKKQLSLSSAVFGLSSEQWRSQDFSLEGATRQSSKLYIYIYISGIYHHPVGRNATKTASIT